MKKFLSVLLILVLACSFSMVTAVPAGAAVPEPTTQTIEFVPIGGATVEWSTVDSALGDYSVELAVDVKPFDTDWAKVRVLFDPVPLSTFTNPTFLAKGVVEASVGNLLPGESGEGIWNHGPYLNILLDTTGDGKQDNMLEGVIASSLSDYNPEEWRQVEGTRYYRGADLVLNSEGDDAELGHWQGEYPEADVVGIRIALGYSSHTEDNQVVHIDGVTMGDTAYDLEPGVINIDTDEGFNTIQAAIDDSETVDTHTITVAAGTYNERIDINKSLTLEGANAGTNVGVPVTEVRVPESIINAQGVPFGVLIYGTGTVATFDGFTVENYQRVGILAGSFSLDEDDPDVVHILNNIVTEPITQQNNNCIQVADGTTGTIIGNEVMGASLESPDWSGSGILVSGSSDVLVSNNYVHDCEGGIQIQGYAEHRDAPAENNIVEKNLVEDSGTGIVPQMNSIGTIIRYNDVLTNGIGIEVMAMDYSWPEHSTPSGTQIHYNNIVGNGEGVVSGVWVSDPPYIPTGITAEEVEATNNWWGHSSGPSEVGSGSGDTVSTNVYYEPWLLAEDGPTFDKTLALKDGWTLVSTDKAVAGDSIWEGKKLAYTYTPGGGYTEVTPAALVPVDALYVKTVGGGGVGINYSADWPVASSKDLKPGWNLISSATETNAKAVLSPLQHVQVGQQQGVGLTTLVSQGKYNQFTGSLYLATLTGADWDALAREMLCPFDGYWVYMNAAKSFGVIPD